MAGVNLFSGSPTPPDLYQQEQTLALQQALASRLAQSGGVNTDGWNQMRQVPKLGLGGAIAGGLSPLASALLQKNVMKGQQDINSKRWGMMQQALGAMGGQGNPAPNDNTQTDVQPSFDMRGQGMATPQPNPQQQPPQQQGGGFGGAMNTATMAQFAGVPEEVIKAYLASRAPTDTAKLANEAGADPGQAAAGQLFKNQFIAPEAVRQGTGMLDPKTRQFIAYNPSTPEGAMPTYAPGSAMPSGIQALPGSVEAAAALKGATTGATVANTPQTLPTAGGGSTFGYPGDLLHLQPPALRGQPGQAPQQGPAPTPQAAHAGSPAPAAQAPAGPWANIPKLDIPAGLGAPDTFTKKVLEDAAGKHTELASKYGAESDLADQKLQYNSEAMKALPSAEVGPLSHFLTENRAKLAEIAPSLAGILGKPGSVPATQELNKNLVNAAIQGAKSLYGTRMTQNEVNLQKNEASPSAVMAPVAIKSLIEQDNVRNQYAKQRAEDYSKYRAQGGDPNRFESWYSTKFPLKTFAQKASTPPQALEMLKSNPKMKDAFREKYGWVPDGL